MSLDSRRVLIFREVARSGSVSGGARALGLTQPAVSQHLRALEAEIGTPLFLRGSGGVTPTEAGERLLARADRIAAELGHAESELADLAAGGGTVTLAAFPSAMAELVPRALAVLAKRAPQLHVRVLEAEPPEALAAVHASDVDLAVAFEYAETPGDDGLSHTELYGDPTLVVLAARHPLAAEKSIAIGELSEERWVAGCPRCRTHLQALAAEAGFNPDIQHETDDYVAVQSFVACTDSVALLPATALAAHRRRGVVVKRLGDASGRSVMAKYRAGANEVPAVRAVLAALQQVSPRVPARVAPAN